MGQHTVEHNGFREAAIESELLAFLHVRTPSLLAVYVVNGILVVFVLSSAVPAPWLTVWAIGFNACMLWRAAVWLRFRNRDQADWSRRWRRHSLIGTVLTASLWGVFGGLFFVPESPPHVVFQAFVIGGMTAGAIGSITVLRGGYEMYLILCAAPFAARLALSGQPQFLTMGAIYIAVLMYIGRQSRGALAEAVSLRLFDNANLVRTLDSRVRERTGELERVNTQLAEDIRRRERAEQDLSRNADRQAAIADLGQQALTGIDLDALFCKVVNAASAGLAANCAAILEFAPQSNTFIVRAAAGARAAADDRYPVDLDSVAGRALFGRHENGTDIVQREELPELPAQTADAAVAIWGGEWRFGVLEVCNREPRLLGEDDLNFLQALAAVLAAAIQRKLDEDKLQRLAHYDPLTGLPNRALFRDFFNSAVSRARRSGDQVALCMIDLDHFKDVNDTRGHAFGDRLLAEVGNRLRACHRAMDTPARLGGDEFAIVLNSLHGPADAATIAMKIVAALSQPFFINNDEVFVGASIGVTLCPADGDDPDQLLRNADLALYRAKSEGGDRFAFFSAEMAAYVERRRAIEHDLRRALVGNQLDVHYQPQVALADHRIVGAEALLRWRWPGAAFVSNADFIPLAEQSTLIQLLGSWVLDRVCSQAHEWRAGGRMPFTTAVNVSAAECRHVDFETRMKRVAEDLRCNFSSLEIEITESLFMPSKDARVIDSLRRLREHGLSIAVDDFGTGYCSLGRLPGLPVDKLKIDGAFIAALGHDHAAEATVRSIINLARNCGVVVVAEAVETETQLAFLKAEGCDLAQGFLLGRPVPPADFPRTPLAA